MADLLSIAASVIVVATLAYQSCKTLNEAIGSFVNAPKTLQALRRDLDALQTLLDLLQGAVGGVPNDALSPNQRSCFEALKPALEGCTAT
jgi:hypothetical protein